MFNIKVDYPNYDEERRIISLATKDEAAEITKVLSGRAILNMQKLVRSVPVGDFVTGTVNEWSPINMDRFMRGENPIQTCTVHVRRDLLLKFGGFRPEQEYLEDLELCLESFDFMMQQWVVRTLRKPG